MKRSPFILLIFISGLLLAQTSDDTWSVKLSNGLIYRYQPTINALTSKGWEYSNTIITHGMEKVFNAVPDSIKYQNYIKSYIDAYVNSSGALITPLSYNSLDRTHPALSCLFLYEKTGLLKYKTMATAFRNIYVGASASYPKTATGNIFWHKNNGTYNDIILIDGVYMLHPFLAKYGSMFGDNAAIDTAVDQTLYIYNQLYDNTRHLIRHAWNPTKTQSWADPVTGNSGSVWSRGMGWFCMALVDILKYVPASHPRRTELITALNNLAVGIKNYQDPTTGMWYQVVDKGSSLANNYLETSGSAMFVYTLKVASDSGWISNTYLPVAQKAWDYIKVTSNGIITINGDGYPQVNGFAPAMSVQTSDANYVQASLQPVSTPGTTHPHGYAAILMAASVMEFPITASTLPVHFISFSARKINTDIKLNWENEDETGVDYYEIQKSNDGNHFVSAGKISADGHAAYSWTDKSPAGTILYYRIKAVSRDRKETFSNIISIKNTESNLAMFSASPNPAKNGVFMLTIGNPESGNYQMEIINTTGTMVFKKEIKIAGETIHTESIQIPAVSKGVYQVIVTDEHRHTHSVAVVVN